jgi:CHAT domain-containing protein
LQTIGPEISTLSDNFLSVLYYTNLGDAELRLEQNRDAQAALQSAIAFAEQDLRSLTDEPSRIEWTEKSSRAYRDLVQLKLDAGDVNNALELYEWYRGAALRSGKAHEIRPYPSTVHRLALNEVAGHLSSLTGETVLSYARLRKGFVVWTYDDRGITFHRIQSDPERIASVARNFRRLCSDRTSSLGVIRKQARILYDLLIAPFEDTLSSGRTLVIEADDELTGLPFEALLDKDGHHLADRAIINYSLGLYYQDHLRRGLPISPDLRVLIAAVPETKVSTDQPLPPLSDALDEGNEVAGNFHSPEILRGSEASLNALRSRLGKAAVFHFAGHAVASVRQSGLLLSDTVLTYDSLRKLDLSRMQMAVLSGCDTMGVLEDGNYDPDSLVRLLAYAGVPHFVASRWSVDSEATRDFMNMFYAELVQGKTVSSALSQSRAWLRTQNGRKHPYYWAAFTHFGVD